MQKTVESIIQGLESICPARWAFDFDNVGLQIGNPGMEVSGGVVSLDWSQELIEFAESKGANLLVCHHPLFFEPVRSLTADVRSGAMALELAAKRMAMVAAHTNWDAAPGGVNDSLAQAIGLDQVVPFGDAADDAGFKIVAFCPVGSTQAIVDALSQAGAGRIGDYARCAFSSDGVGTFVADECANPAIGETGRVEEVAEQRLEMRVRKDRLAAAIEALRRAHPYEEPAFDVVPLANPGEMPLGRIGELSEPLSLEEFADHAGRMLNSRPQSWGARDSKVRRVAVVGGAGDSMWRSARAAGADVLLTGEAKQDRAIDAEQAGFALVAAGHYATEQPGTRALCDKLTVQIDDVRWHLFEPEPGCGGRPL